MYNTTHENYLNSLTVQQNWVCDQVQWPAKLYSRKRTWNPCFQPSFYICDNWNNNNKIFLVLAFPKCGLSFFAVDTRDIKNFVQILIYFLKQTLSKYEQKCCRLFQRSKITFTSCFVVYPVCYCAILVPKETAAILRVALTCLLHLSRSTEKKKNNIY